MEPSPQPTVTPPPSQGDEGTPEGSPDAAPSTPTPTPRRGGGGGSGGGGSGAGSAVAPTPIPLSEGSLQVELQPGQLVGRPGSETIQLQD